MLKYFYVLIGNTICQCFTQLFRMESCVNYYRNRVTEHFQLYFSTEFEDP